MIVTFYSFKGGVGRSMAVANTAQILADRGYRIVVCDWDLEAPGIERYFVDGDRPSGETPQEWRQRRGALLAPIEGQAGIIDMLNDYKTALAQPQPTALTAGDLTNLGGVTVRKPSSYAQVVHKGHGEKSFDLITAGNRSSRERYADAVRAFDWNDFYERWAGAAYIDFVRSELVGASDAYDIALIDSRTGVTEHAGICTHQLADLVVLMTGANEANVEGTRWMAQVLSKTPLERFRKDRRLHLLPVRARVEQAAERDELIRFRDTFDEAFGDLPGANSSARALDLEIPYMPYYSFQERVVAREPQASREMRLLGAYRALADEIVNRGEAAGLIGKKGSSLDAKTTRPRAAPEAGPVTIIARSNSPLAPKLEQLLRARDVRIEQPLSFGPVSTTTRYVIVVDGDLSAREHALINEALRQQSASPDDVRLVALDANDGAYETLGWRSAVTLPARKNVNESTVEKLVNLLRQLRPTPAIVDSGRFPPRGLLPYEERDAAFYFGRDGELQCAIDKLRGSEVQPWIDIYGPGGCGRTSFLHACLIPAIRRGAFGGIGSDAEVLAIQAGEDPTHSLAKALHGRQPRVESETVADVRAELLKDGLGRFLRKKPMVLAVDDLRDVYTGGGEAARDFEQLISRELTRSSGRLWLVTTCREEALPRRRFGIDPGVAILLGPVGLDHLRDGLERAARLRGYTWEEGVVRRICTEYDLLARRTLPFTSELIRILYAESTGRVLTHAVYDRVKGIAGVAVGNAVACANRWSLAESERIRHLLPKLVSSDGSPHGLPERTAVELLTDGRSGESGRSLLNRLAADRVIRIGNEVKLADPALSAEWPLLQSWIRDSAPQLHAREAVEAMATHWERAGRRWRDYPRILQTWSFARLRGVNPLAVDYVRRARRLWKLIGAAIVIPLLAGTIAATYTTIAAQRAQATRVATLVQSARRASNYDAGVTFALAALKTTRSPSEESLLREMLHRNHPLLTMENVSPASIIALKRDASAVLVFDDDKQLRSSPPYAVSPSVWNSVPGPFAVSAETDTLIAGDRQGLVTMWNIRTGEKIAEVQVFHGEVSAIDISTTGHRFAAAAPSGVIAVGDIATNTRFQRAVASVGEVHAVRFTPDAQALVVMGGSVAVWRWSVDNKTRSSPALIGDHPTFAVTNDVVVSGSTTGLLMWHINAPETSPSRRLTQSCTVSPGAIRGNTVIATVPDDSIARLIQVTGSRTTALGSVDATVTCSTFLTDHEAVTGYSDGRVQFWKFDPMTLMGQETFTLNTNTNGVGIERIMATPDGSKILTIGDGRRLTVWDVSTRTLPSSLDDLIGVAESHLARNTSH